MTTFLGPGLGRETRNKGDGGMLSPECSKTLLVKPHVLLHSHQWYWGLTRAPHTLGEHCPQVYLESPFSCFMLNLWDVGIPWFEFCYMCAHLLSLGR